MLAVVLGSNWASASIGTTYTWDKRYTALTGIAGEIAQDGVAGLRRGGRAQRRVLIGCTASWARCVSGQFRPRRPLGEALRSTRQHGFAVPKRVYSTAQQPGIEETWEEPVPENINILVLSDLHIDDKKLTNQKIVLGALYDDLRVISDSDLKPDYVIFAGDLVNNPDDPDAYLIFLEAFFLPVMQTTSIPDTNFFFIPGNHDVSRAAIARFETENDGILSKMLNQEAINRIYQNQRSANFIAERQYSFFQTLEALQTGKTFSENPFIISSQYDADKLAFLGLNTAIFSMGGTRGSEERRLAFPDFAINEALASIPTDYALVTVFHHPMEWLTEQAASEIKSSLVGRSNVLISGHLHRPEPKLERSPNGSLVSIQLPSLFSTRNYLNGYALLSISRNDQHVRVTYRTYFDGRRRFDKGLNIAADGTFFPTEEGEKYFLKNEENLSHQRFQRWLSESVIAHLAPTLEESTIDKPLSTIFVEPPLLLHLSSTEARRETDPTDLEQKINIETIASSRENYFVLVPPEYGQTSLARRTASIIIERSIDLPRNATTKPHVPIIIDVNDNPLYEANIIRRLKAWLPDTATLGHTSQSLMDRGFVTLIFENLDVVSKDSFEFLSTFRKKYPNSRYIYFIKSPLQFGAEGALKIPFDEGITRVEVRTFSRSLVRRLVEKWKLDQAFSTDVIVEQIISRFRLLAIPITPVNITIFLTVVETVRGFTPINTASLIENYIDVVLEKYDLHAAFRATFDYKNKVDYLAHVAKFMVRNDQFRLDYSDLYNISESYFRGKMLDQRPQEVVEYFIGAKIFENIGNLIQFRLNIFESYFIAQAMITESQFRQEIVSQFTKFGMEIDIYCGTQRGDSSVIEHVAMEYQKLSDAVFSEVKINPKLLDLDSFVLPADPTALGVLKRVTRYAFNPKVSKEAKESLIEQRDAELAYVAVQANMSRPEVRNIMVQWALALRTYSFCLKNLELLTGAEKEKHLKIILDGWGRGMALAIVALRVLVELGEMDFDGVTIKSDIEREGLDKLSGHVARFLFLSIPTIISYYLRNDLGSDKLDLVLRREDRDRPSSVEFMRASLFLDLRLKEYPGIINKIIRRIGKNKFLIEAMVFKLRDFYLRSTLEPVDDMAVRKLVGDLFQQLPADDSVTGRRGAAARDMQSMTRKKIVKTIKDKLSDRDSL